METTTYTATWSEGKGYDNETKCKQENPKAITARMRDKGAARTKGQLSRELSALIGEARSKYGNNYIIVNEASENDPIWKIVHQNPKGSGGIAEEDIFDRWL
ncbi:DUF4148 domain-containing protein [Bacillus mycoides]|uniref:DUF4148 domain-containing protein n=1 Tax=Bacillus mycoides TaxID=1405 RepID=UPI003D1F368B